MARNESQKGREWRGPVLTVIYLRGPAADVDGAPVTRDVPSEKPRVRVPAMLKPIKQAIEKQAIDFFCFLNMILCFNTQFMASIKTQYISNKKRHIEEDSAFYTPQARQRARPSRAARAATWASGARTRRPA